MKKTSWIAKHRLRISQNRISFLSPPQLENPCLMFQSDNDRFPSAESSINHFVKFLVDLIVDLEIVVVCKCQSAAAVRKGLAKNSTIL